MMACWQKAGKKAGEAKIDGEIDAYEQKFLAMNEKMKAMEAEMQELRSKLDAQTSKSSGDIECTSKHVEEAKHSPEPPDTSSSTRIADANQTLVFNARKDLIEGSVGHAQKVLISATGNFPDVDERLLDEPEVTPQTLPQLKVPLVLAPIGEGQSFHDAVSFMQCSESYAQKALIHSIASMDPNFLVQLERPSDSEPHLQPDTKYLGTPNVDLGNATDAEFLVHTSKGITTKALVHAIASVPESKKQVLE